MSLEDIVARQASLIRQLQGALRGMSFDFGTDTMSWAASADSGPKTIAHDLGRVPTYTFVFNADTNGSFAGIANYTTANRTSTHFDAYGRAVGSITTSKAIFWVAIG